MLLGVPVSSARVPCRGAATQAHLGIFRQHASCNIRQKAHESHLNRLRTAFLRQPGRSRLASATASAAAAVPDAPKSNGAEVNPNAHWAAVSLSDVYGGITAAVVALPLALALGVASGLVLCACLPYAVRNRSSHGACSAFSFVQELGLWQACTAAYLWASSQPSSEVCKCRVLLLLVVLCSRS